MTAHYRSYHMKLGITKNHHCTVCKMKFDRPAKLSEHYQRKHKMINPHVKSNAAKAGAEY